MRIRPVAESDLEPWLELRHALWPDADREDLRAELPEFLVRVDDRAVLVAEDDDGVLWGFVELSLRNIVDGCESSPVGYLEGWYVRSEARHRGVGRALVDAAEAWARGKGCTEMGSDTELDNRLSQTAHRALGYEATGTVVCFRKPLA